MSRDVISIVFGSLAGATVFAGIVLIVFCLCFYRKRNYERIKSTKKNVQLYCENGLEETIRSNLLRKFKTINFVDCQTKAQITASEPLVVLCTFQTRIEDSCNAAMEELQDCKSVVLVVFRRIIGSVTKDSIVSGCFYEHPGVKKTIYARFDGNKTYFLRTDEEFLKNKADKIGDAESCI